MKKTEALAKMRALASKYMMRISIDQVQANTIHRKAVEALFRKASIRLE